MFITCRNIIFALSKMMTKASNYCSVLFVLLFVTHIVSIAHGHPGSSFSKNLLKRSGPGVEVPWISLSYPSEAIERNPEPAGIEAGATTFLCRAQYNNLYKPGVLVVVDGSIYCSFDLNGPHKSDTFQMLDVARGTTSWLPFTIEVPENAIIAGNHPSGKYAYVCRGWRNDSLYVGNFGFINNVPYCHISPAKAENMFNLHDNLEILVVNHLGKRYFE